MSTSFEWLLADLQRPEAYPHPVDAVEVAQTHVSAVFLAGEFAYKVKKPVDFGFLDYSTLERRERFCHEELQLNRRLCRDLYLDVLPIIERDGRAVIDPDAGPTDAVEWAVRMRRLPEARMLPQLLAAKAADEVTFRRIAGVLAKFHASAAADTETRRFGQPDEVEKTVAGNLKHAGDAARELLSPDVFRELRAYIAAFVQTNDVLLQRRAEQGSVRRCHGDLRLQNLCLHPSIGSGIQIFDCIEFNPRYQCVDVIADLAYLAMDLDLTGRADLRWALVDEYRACSQDADLSTLLRFYQCYRACVRGKIGMLAAADPEISVEKRQAEAEIAEAAFALARSYAGSRPQTLTAMHGHSGSGKSTVARHLARTQPAILLSTDDLRKADLEEPHRQRLPASDYAPEQRRSVYEALFAQASSWLQRGESVILDATFLCRRDRDAARSLAASHGVAFRFEDCPCDDAEIRRRLQERAAINESTSDATEAVYDLQLAAADPLAADE